MSDRDCEPSSHTSFSTSTVRITHTGTSTHTGVTVNAPDCLKQSGIGSSSILPHPCCPEMNAKNEFSVNIVALTLLAG